MLIRTEPDEMTRVRVILTRKLALRVVDPQISSSLENRRLITGTSSLFSRILHIEKDHDFEWRSKVRLMARVLHPVKEARPSRQSRMVSSLDIASGSTSGPFLSWFQSRFRPAATMRSIVLFLLGLSDA